MRYIKPDYYDRFTCTAEKCPATCCAGWQIVIDEFSLEKYAGIEGGFGNRIRNSIDWEEGIFYQYDGRCAFLNEENLCDLQSILGEETLCETCRRYPRHIEEYDGLREYSLSLSCPEAARIMLENKKKVKFIQCETAEEDDFEEFDFLMFTQLEDAREIIFRIIQNREVDLRMRMKKILDFSGELQKCVDEERCFDVDRVTEKYKEWSADGWKQELSYKDMDFQERYMEMMKHFTVFYKLEHLRPEWTEVLNRTWKLLFEKGSASYGDICTEFQKIYGYESKNREEWETMGEQLLMFFVYTYFCGAVYDDCIYSKMQLSVFSTLWIQEFFIALWAENKGKTGKQEFIETAYCYAREVEHSDRNLDILEQWFARNKMW